jgi:hypothetical protein
MLRAMAGFDSTPPRSRRVASTLVLLACSWISLAHGEARERPVVEAPAARTGFQMALESGLSVPFGDATDLPGDDLERRYSWQIPFNVELGAKFTEAFYVGTYLGLAVGAEGDDPTIEDHCEDDDDDGENDVSCASVNLYLGLEARYSFAPGARWNPWLSYGIGYEGGYQSIRDHERGYSESTMSSGITYARLSGGLDQRSRAVGFGPALHLAVGRFERSETEIGQDLAYRGPIDDPAFHVWATLGLRMVIRP